MDIGSKIKELRIKKGFTQSDLALYTGFSKSYIQKFEENKRDIKSSQLIKLAMALGSSISEMLSTTNFNDNDYVLTNIEFRKKNNLIDVESFTNEITADVHFKYNAYQQLENILNEKIKFKNPVLNNEISSSEEIEDVVLKLRQKWKFGTTPIYDIVSFLEDLGIKIFEVDRDENFVGLSYWVKKTPVILINIRNKNITRRRFTLLHELCHLLVKFKSGISKNTIERFCDQFAGAMLLPKDILEQYLNSDIISLEELKRIKIKYGISISAILVRMVSINFIDWEKYHEWKLLYNSWNNKDIEYNGRENVNRFDYLLARALREEKISYSKASELVQKPVSELTSEYIFKRN